MSNEQPLDPQAAANMGETAKDYERWKAGKKAEAEQNYRDSIGMVDPMTHAQSQRYLAEALQRQIDESPAQRQKAIEGFKKHFGEDLRIGYDELTEAQKAKAADTIANKVAALQTEYAATYKAAMERMQNATARQPYLDKLDELSQALFDLGAEANLDLL